MKKKSIEQRSFKNFKSHNHLNIKLFKGFSITWNSIKYQQNKIWKKYNYPIYFLVLILHLVQQNSKSIVALKFMRTEKEFKLKTQLFLIVSTDS